MKVQRTRYEYCGQSCHSSGNSESSTGFSSRFAWLSHNRHSALDDSWDEKFMNPSASPVIIETTINAVTNRTTTTSMISIALSIFPRLYWYCEHWVLVVYGGISSPLDIHAVGASSIEASDAKPAQRASKERSQACCCESPPKSMIPDNPSFSINTRDSAAIIRTDAAIIR